MKERPILFSAPMVRALLDGTKTQTRRLVKDYPNAKWEAGQCGILDDGPIQWNLGGMAVKCPYGRPGDRLWVRETWQSFGDSSTIRPPVPHSCQVRYNADGVANWLPVPINAKGVFPGSLKSRPSIHMPRWASRITLEIEAIRLERLQAISGYDSIAEGIERAVTDLGDSTVTTFRDYHTGTTDRAARQSYQTLWESINGPDSWTSNPWVWVITFKRIQP